ncbi:hypothetical protein ST47_g625 [Ascochyta rabiei]|uniref:Uncharacterized protein n=1 Tax=Didymella rabiei TaxID=5454 RepID=A0A163LYG5_DIDRA|nr:hypothetical protein ST47_g625 [Ascochyta rabiei]
MARLTATLLLTALASAEYTTTVWMNKVGNFDKYGYVASVVDADAQHITMVLDYDNRTNKSALNIGDSNQRVQCTQPPREQSNDDVQCTQASGLQRRGNHYIHARLVTGDGDYDTSMKHQRRSTGFRVDGPVHNPG